MGKSVGQWKREARKEARKPAKAKSSAPTSYEPRTDRKPERVNKKTLEQARQRLLEQGQRRVETPRKIQNGKCPICRGVLTVDASTIYWPARGNVHAKCWKRRFERRFEKSQQARRKKRTAPPVTVRRVDMLADQLLAGQKAPEVGQKTAKVYTTERGKRYQEYIASDAWAAKRREYWQRYGYSCKAKGCRVTQDLHVHHHTYLRLGHEDLSDLVGLCIPHHEAVHRHHDGTKRKESLTRSTEIVTGLVLVK